MRRDIASLLKVGSIIALIVVIIGYAYFRTRDLVKGVRIEVTNVSDGQTFTEPFLEITGRAKNASTLTINDRVVGVDQEGGFKESLILLPGYNIITLRADDRFGKHIEKQYRIVLKEDTPTVPITAEPQLSGAPTDTEPINETPQDTMETDEH